MGTKVQKGTGIASLELILLRHSLTALRMPEQRAPATRAEFRAGAAVSSQRAGKPRVLEPQKGLYPADPTARREVAEKEKRREELPHRARHQEMSANPWRGTAKEEFENENTKLGRRRERFFLPRSAPPGARPPMYTNYSSRSSFPAGVAAQSPTLCPAVWLLLNGRAPNRPTL